MGGKNSWTEPPTFPSAKYWLITVLMSSSSLTWWVFVIIPHSYKLFEICPAWWLLIRQKIDQLFVPCQPRLSVEWDAFEDSSRGKEATTSWNRIPLGGSVTIMNTVEAFKVPYCTALSLSSVLSFHVLQAVDKAAFLQQEGQRLWDNILQNCWEKNPDTLARCRLWNKFWSAKI